MNNQRERRYKFVDEVRLFKQKGFETSNCLDYFDSNAISPGTSFMLELHTQLESFLYTKMNTDPLWQRLEVIFSGVDVPGEGEHKMMQYMRENQQANVRHCLYGLDADLIVLGLASHQPFVVVLREEVNLTYIREDSPRKMIGDPPKYQLIYLSLLREYLHLDFSSLPSIDLERLIDDFVLFVAFIGNDFIPRLPTFEISEGSINFLIDTYKRIWHEIGYISHSGVVIWPALAQFLVDLPKFEKKALEERINSKGKRRENSQPIPADKQFVSLQKIYTQGVTQTYNHTKKERQKAAGEEIQEGAGEEEIVEDELKAEDEEETDNDKTERLKEHLKGVLKDGGMEQIKAKYYQECFGFDTTQEAGTFQVRFAIKEYLRGLQWVLFYYYRGCPDWEWFYPFHYAPMISDFLEVSELMAVPADSEVAFHLHKPYKPLEQLVTVLPPDSAHLLPESYRPILTSVDNERFFPKKPRIEYDFLCAKIGWQSLKIILPFVSLALVQELTSSIPDTEETQAKNVENTDYRYQYSDSTPAHPVIICKLYP